MSDHERPPDYDWFVGIDWGEETHQVCVVDHDGEIHAERALPHSGAGLASMIDFVVELGDVGKIAVSIEVPRGPVVEGLVERGLHVFAINPKQLDRFRDRHTVGGAKDDRRDAQVLARSLRTDLPSFRRVRLDDPLVIQLRELSRTDDDLDEDLRRATNRLRGLLHRTMPAVLELCPAADEPWFWDVLARATTPTRAAHLKATVVSSALRRHRIRRVDAVAVLRAFQAPSVPAAPGVSEAVSQHMSTLLPQVELLHRQRAENAARIGALLEQLAGDPETEPGQTEEHRDVQILLSFVGVGKNVAAAMLAEASQALADRDYHSLRIQAGTAPVTRQSGKRRSVVMRRACNPRLRDAVYHWGRVAAIYDPRARQRYAELRGRGHSHGRAVRGLADGLLRVLIGALKSRTLYQLSHPAEVRP